MKSGLEKMVESNLLALVPEGNNHDMDEDEGDDDGQPQLTRYSPTGGLSIFAEMKARLDEITTEQLVLDAYVARVTSMLHNSMGMEE